MKAGELNESIEFYRQVSEVDEYGEATVAYVFMRKSRAKVAFGKSWRAVVNDAIEYSKACYFTVYNHKPVNEYSLIRWKDEFYRITAIGEYPEEQKYEITAEVVNDSTITI